jgi:hypothetical protein
MYASKLVMSRGKRFESARRLSNFPGFDRTPTETALRLTLVTIQLDPANQFRGSASSRGPRLRGSLGVGT